MKNRESILTTAALCSNEKEFAPGFVVRRISPREEFLLDLIGSPLLDYAALAAGNVKLRHADLQRALFVCSSEFESTKDAILSGTFDTLFFDFLKKIPSREIEAKAFTYLVSDATAIAAADFEAAETPAPDGKNVRSRAQTSA